VPLLEKLIEDHGSVRCLVELTDLHGIEPRALWDEIKFDVHHARQIERCAVVGDRRWEAWMTRLSRPIFVRAEIRFFDRARTGPDRGRGRQNGDFLRRGGQARTVSAVNITAVIGSQLTYCVEVAAELLADVEEQTVRSVHQAQRPG